MTEARSERILAVGDSLCYLPSEDDDDGDDDSKPGVYIAGKPLDEQHNYFEFIILDVGDARAICIGLCNKDYPLDKQPGWVPESIGYHADDGRLYKAQPLGMAFGPPCDIGDKMGCGIKSLSRPDDGSPLQTVSVFFTRNGAEIGTQLMTLPADGLYPCVGLHSNSDEVRLFLDLRWVPEEDMCMDGNEDDWCRLDGVRLNGQVLEYAGKGNAPTDVGLAQANLPLTTGCHYFEAEIVDPGKSCYIAVGLAKKDYPRHQLPGWKRGSVAYHADDGKVFVGSGLGLSFGPQCHKGDVIGCGILFPRDYISPPPSEESTPVAPYSLGEQFQQNDDFSVFMWEELEAPQGGSGLKVQVFFTRNGKNMGSKEAVLPCQGFHPTVGMLSAGEKVRVELKPLTG